MWNGSWPPTQMVSQRMDLRNYRPDAEVARWATYQVTSTRSTTGPQVPHRFIAFQEALACFSAFQTTTAPQSVAHRHVTPFDTLVVSPQARCSPVRMWKAPGHAVATALTYG